MGKWVENSIFELVKSDIAGLETDAVGNAANAALKQRGW